MATRSSHERHIRRLEWAIWLSQVNLNGFRDGDWLNLQQDFREHIASSFSASIAGVVPIPQEHVDELVVSSLATKAKQGELEKLQRSIKEDLKKIAYSGENEPSDLLPVTTFPIEEASIVVEGYSPNEPFKLSISTQAGTGFMIQRVLYEDLVGSRIIRGQLRICPVCQAVFLIKRKPRADKHLHCSLKCSRLAATRRYRKKQAEKYGEQVKAKERERSHRRHVTRQQKRFPGRKVKVQRRPRTSDQP
jgi:hypothetical protein